MNWRAASLLTMAMLGACSSGGTGSSPTPAPTPTPTPAPAPSPSPSPSPSQPPSFTSPATASVIENTAGSFYQAAATDPEGGTVSYTIAGGADAGKFSITTAGALAFTTAPNYDLAGDADGDNNYDLQLRATDSGGTSGTLNLRVTVTNSREGIAVRRVATGFRQPVFVTAIPGDADALFVVEKGGSLYRFNPANGDRSLLLTVPNVRTSGEGGLLAIAPLPDFQSSRQVLVTATAADGALQLIQYGLPTTGTAAPGTVILNIPHADHDQHYGGWLAFGPDGYLYLSTGDGGTRTNAPDTNILLGKMLRLSHNGGSTSTNWGAAPGNPFVSGGGHALVYAYGFRNPWRAAFDGSRMLIADVGEGSIEEVDELRTSQPGLNFGWPTREGTSGGANATGLTDPVTQYSHGNGPRQGASIIGGYVYRGPIASLVGQYVFADYISKNFWSVPATSLVAGQVLDSSRFEQRNLDFKPDVGTSNQPVSFGVDGNGNLYLVDLGGEIYQFVPG